MENTILEIQPKKKTAGSAVKAFWRKLTGKDGTTHSMDRLYLLIVLLLVVFGLVMLFSASYAYAFYWKGDSFYYIRKQLLFALVGFAAMFALSLFDYRHFQKLFWAVYGVALALLGAVFAFPPLNNARRWIIIPGIVNFQPSEIAKFAIIVMFASMIHRFGDDMRKAKFGLVPFVLVLLPVAVLVALEPHISGTLIICAIGVIMMIIGGTRLYWFGLFGGIGVAGLVAFVFLSEKMDYVIQRVNIWLDPWKDPVNDGFQIIQSLLAIGSGGFGGAGLGNSKQKYMYIPEPANDFIFSVICEELGFIGASLIVILFGLLIWRGIVIAYRARETFGGMLAMGITLQVGLQAMLNIMVVSGVVPNTGISLPFFSYGGTSLMMLLAEMGIVLSVSRGCSAEKK